MSPFRLGIALLVLLLAGCATLSPEQRARAEEIAIAGRSQVVECPSGCHIDSPLLALGHAAVAASAPGAPRHHVVLLDGGQDSLLARVHLIRAARESIDVQMFIFDADDSGQLVLDELLAAARRGVKVRVLLDQLYGLADPNLQATLAGAHVNFELRLYNPTFDEAKTQQLEYAAGVLFSFRRFNQRMHSKLMLFDDVVGITGGRNIQDRYFDWAKEYNYRDRDLLVAGPVAAAMGVNFDAFWDYERSVPSERLGDVGERLLGAGAVPVHPLLADDAVRAARVRAMAALAADGAAVWERLEPFALPVGRVEFHADLPEKHDDAAPAHEDASREMRDLIAGAESDIVLQTPYLVLSRQARDLFTELQARGTPPQVWISTNSLAATDAFPVYAMSHKYKRLYLRELGFRIHEYKPYPADSPIDLAATGALEVVPDVRIPRADLVPRAPKTAGEAAAAARAERLALSGGVDPRIKAREEAIAARERALAAAAAAEAERAARADTRQPLFGSGSRGSAGPVPLRGAGVRVGLHAKSMVVDDRIGVVGTHNFDPRSDNLNTESMVVVHDADFATALRASIVRDMSPENAWLIARDEKPPVLSGLVYSLGKVSEALPVFDIWPFPYATSWELRPGCEPLPPDDPRFAECYENVGAFPEVDLPLKTVYTRILTAFGAGLIPIL
ncbi:phospholipase D family protein [Arenimonas composti]|uniref:PLD phosphodiesterase domain-containing protein n=1 Tax=Arenimonas composti TR7-09 = DSM 18010 TaxID=1121013 RepID=A0A091BG04_9GAMM|nr:phospholipase D family protein [Arenimonas composti]KFN50681.1 hypothetical protein P873_05835 [Arenimonas composti TR7-09 = DSM 18010]